MTQSFYCGDCDATYDQEDGPDANICPECGSEMENVDDINDKLNIELDDDEDLGDEEDLDDEEFDDEEDGEELFEY